MDLIIPALLWRSIPQNGSDMLQIVIQTPTPPDTPRMLQLSRGKNYSPAHARHMPLEPKKAKSHHLATPRVSIWDLPASILEPGGSIWDVCASVFYLWGSILDLWPLFWSSWCQRDQPRGTPWVCISPMWAQRHVQHVQCGCAGMCGEGCAACAGACVGMCRQIPQPKSLF
jgi:hypothetical protein